MGENKGQTIFLSVIGIATLLVAIIGATFAYFTTTVTNSSSAVTVETARVANVTMTSSLAGINDILPGKSYDAGTVTLTTDINSGSKVTIPYTCKLVYTGNVTDLQYKIVTTSDEDGTKGTVSDNASTTWVDVPATTATAVATGTLTASNLTDKFDISYRFKETGTSQNNEGNPEYGQSGKSSTITFSCAVNNQYYTDAYFNGTTGQPASQAD